MNAALRKALAAAQLTETDVAAHLGVDPKTVRRWLSGQRPYPRHRWALADLLRSDEESLWPEQSQAIKDSDPLSEHAHRVYAHRWQVPREVWYDLFSGAKQEIGILVYSGLFLADDAGIIQLLRAQSHKGVRIRILLGDPESQAVVQRGKDEEIGSNISARSKNSILLFRELRNARNIDLRIHGTTLYNSLYINERKILANHHIYGFTASNSPVLEIDRSSTTGMPEIYANSFERVWENATKYSGFHEGF